MKSKNSKTLKTTDDSSARLIKNILAGENGYGIDIEIIFKTNRLGWAIIEFLKCESKYVTPTTSHPSRYWYKNWRKFVKLWEIANKISAKLFLVNYEELSSNKYGKFKIMEVDMQQRPSSRRPITTMDFQPNCDFETFQAWYMGINNDAVLM